MRTINPIAFVGVKHLMASAADVIHSRIHATDYCIDLRRTRQSLPTTSLGVAFPRPLEVASTGHCLLLWQASASRHCDKAGNIAMICLRPIFGGS